jgi:hypothetical protein
MGLKALCRDGVTANRCARVGVPRRHRARPAVVVDEPAVGWPTRAGRPEREPLTDLRVSPGYPAISDVSRWDYRTMVPDTRASWFCAPSGSLQRDTGQPPGRVISGSQTPLGRLLVSRSIDQRAGPRVVDRCSCSAVPGRPAATPDRRRGSGRRSVGGVSAASMGVPDVDAGRPQPTAVRTSPTSLRSARGAGATVPALASGR